MHRLFFNDHHKLILTAMKSRSFKGSPPSQQKITRKIQVIQKHWCKNFQNRLKKQHGKVNALATKSVVNNFFEYKMTLVWPRMSNLLDFCFNTVSKSQNF